MAKWEYKSISKESKGMLEKKMVPKDVDTDLNGMGKEGWELVTSSQITMIGTTTRMFFVFKRELT